MKQRNKIYLIRKKIVAFMKRQKQCFELPYFGAHYPDATCIEGNLHDLDKCDEHGNLYGSGEYNPCPVCRTVGYVNNLLDNEVSIEKIYAHMKFISKKYGLPNINK